jgi:hypothetical protein
VNLVGGIVSLAAVALLILPFGLVGAAMGRLLYGAVTTLDLLKVKAELAKSVLPREHVVLISA